MGGSGRQKDFYAALDAIGPILEQYPPATMREGDIYRGLPGRRTSVGPDPLVRN
jgi:hypothetical protein